MLPPPGDGHVATSAVRDEASIPEDARPQDEPLPPLAPRRNTVSIDSAIARPGAVRINVQEAFIVEDDADHHDRAGNGAAAHESRDIRLPRHTAVVSHVAVDIGGSLAKLVYFSREPDASVSGGGRLNFLSFETDRIDECLAFMQRLKREQQALSGGRPGELCVVATGGGAFKHYDDIRQALGVEVLREDEMECLIIGTRPRRPRGVPLGPPASPASPGVPRRPPASPAPPASRPHALTSAGLDFFIAEIPDEVFTYSDADPMMRFEAPRADVYPYLLVNIGSGVSMIKVSGPRQHERIGGTSLGGGTLWGLLSLLTGARSFDDMLAMAERGDNAAVDMLVGDIYGADYGKIGLKSSTIASSFGKVFRMQREAERAAEDGGGLANGDREEALGGPDGPRRGSGAFRSEDISRSLLYAVSNNIGQIAYLQSEKHGLARIYFGGSFIRGHRQTINTLSYAIRFWSAGAKRAYFLRHEGYLGAVGAFLRRQPRNWGRRNSLEEDALGGRRMAAEAEG
ncbi:MAG: hypothetical protein M1832_000628 [Thelocarpon impressellum]|nr:MAG: hypothetical protein M1832_000628 [Thelocarpon impressellum]